MFLENMGYSFMDNGLHHPQVSGIFWLRYGIRNCLFPYYRRYLAFSPTKQSNHDYNSSILEAVSLEFYIEIVFLSNFYTPKNSGKSPENPEKEAC